MNLTASPAGSTVKGLVIEDFGGGVVIGGGSTDTITDDLIGLTAAGTAAAPNGGNGVTIEGNATKNTITADVISGNIGSGIEINGSGTTGNVVTGNLIGTDVHGAHAVPNNGGAGVNIDGGSSQNTIGGTTAAARNIISGNNSETAGVNIDSPANLVEGNYIGTDSIGKNAVGNGEGVFLGPGATGNTIGGTTAGVGNVISGNTSYGVVIAATSGNLVAGDLIGVNAAGTAPLGNGGDGVFVWESSKNTIGGATTGARNIIIGTNAVANAIVYAPNLAYSNNIGVYITNGASSNTVAFCAISGNFNGVQVDGGSTGNTIAANDIGTGLSGSFYLGHFEYGVILMNVAGNTVENNNIDNNGAYGVLLWSADQNTLTGNNFANNKDGQEFG